MLEGIRVIEMATYIAAPGAGGILPTGAQR